MCSRLSKGFSLPSGITFDMTRMLILVVLLVYGSEAATIERTCRSSWDCSPGTCCRDTAGRVVSRHEGALNHYPHSADVGTCVAKIAQDGELCGDCQCETGLACYAAPSGACCNPSLCYNATWVKEQRHGWPPCADPMDPRTCYLPGAASLG